METKNYIVYYTEMPTRQKFKEVIPAIDKDSANFFMYRNNPSRMIYEIIEEGEEIPSFDNEYIIV